MWLYDFLEDVLRLIYLEYTDRNDALMLQYGLMVPRIMSATFCPITLQLFKTSTQGNIHAPLVCWLRAMTHSAVSTSDHKWVTKWLSNTDAQMNWYEVAHIQPEYITKQVYQHPKQYPFLCTVATNQRLLLHDHMILPRKQIPSVTHLSIDSDTMVFLKKTIRFPSSCWPFIRKLEWFGNGGYSDLGLTRTLNLNFLPNVECLEFAYVFINFTVMHWEMATKLSTLKLLSGASIHTLPSTTLPKLTTCWIYTIEHRHWMKWLYTHQVSLLRELYVNDQPSPPKGCTGYLEVRVFGYRPLTPRFDFKAWWNVLPKVEDLHIQVAGDTGKIYERIAYWPPRLKRMFITIAIPGLCMRKPRTIPVDEILTYTTDQMWWNDLSTHYELYLCLDEQRFQLRDTVFVSI